MVLNSNGNMLMLSIYFLSTTILFFSSHAQILALPNGGFPSGVGKKFLITGNFKGKSSFLSECGIPFLK